MPAATVARACARHPDRSGAAACMSCGSIVCHECASTWEGINYCIACLASKARPAARKASALGWAGLLLACIVLAAVAVEAAVMTGVFLSSP